MSDAEIILATERVVSREGPLAFTLAQVGAEVGLTAAAILKRFDSKRALLLALSESTRHEVPRTFARRPGERALAALERGILEHSRNMRTPREIANGLAFLQIDITDRDFRRVAAEFLGSFRDAIRALLDDAVRDRELARCDTAALARAVEIAFHGSVIAWGVRQEGALDDALRADLRAALEPYRRRPGARVHVET